jgi:hypothetical protein
VQLPDGHKVAQITLEDPSRKVIVSDRAAFTEWVRKRAPEMVTQDEGAFERVVDILAKYDGQPVASARRTDAALAILAELGIDPEPPEPRVSRSYEEALLASLWFVERDPEQTGEDTPQRMLELETGEIVPGVEYEPAGEPTRFRMLYKPSSGAGREAIARAWRENRLPPIEGLPEVES